MAPPPRPPQAAANRQRQVEQLLAAKEVVVACGPGGVGKTTSAAALAATAAARVGGRVLVVTVDPARRLADALGLAGLGNAATRVPAAAFAEAGVTPKGELYAAMVDMSESWDALVKRHAPDARTARQILANPLYQNITGRFAQGHDYIAMERLYELHEEGNYDLLVVDTPPSRNALDLLDAPSRMTDFFSSRLLRWLTVPYRSRLVNLASRPFYQVADRVLGSQLLQDLADFFILFQTMRDGFVARAEAVNRLLSDVRTTFLLVTTLEAVPARDAQEMAQALASRHLHLGLLVCNKVLPPSLSDPATARVADTLRNEAENLASDLPGQLLDGEPPELVGSVLSEVAQSFSNFRLVANREAELLTELAAAHDVTATVGYLPGSITDLAGLLRVGASLWGDAEQTAQTAQTAQAAQAHQAPQAPAPPPPAVPASQPASPPAPARTGRSARGTGSGAPSSTPARTSGVPARPGREATAGSAGRRSAAKAGNSARNTGGAATSENDGDDKEP
ncbi:MAG TPA: ArsA-related P-loop ATPase [Acidimicrobiales bacterium]|nr:ArsA-related P-loop ATPase [Acidimicrobiales bacterium]